MVLLSGKQTQLSFAKALSFLIDNSIFFFKKMLSENLRTSMCISVAVFLISVVAMINDPSSREVRLYSNTSPLSGVNRTWTF